MANLQSLQINNVSFIDIIYPVGSIYETLDESFNPNISFGGVWERIRGRFILGAGIPDDNTHANFGNNLTYNGTDKYDEPVGNMGGSSLQTLTVEEIPSHNHALICECGTPGIANCAPSDTGSYMQVAGTGAGTRANINTVINATGGGQKPQQYAALYCSMYLAESGVI